MPAWSLLYDATNYNSPVLRHKMLKICQISDPVLFVIPDWRSLRRGAYGRRGRLSRESQILSNRGSAVRRRPALHEQLILVAGMSREHQPCARGWRTWGTKRRRCAPSSCGSSTTSPTWRFLAHKPRTKIFSVKRLNHGQLLIHILQSEEVFLNSKLHAATQAADAKQAPTHPPTLLLPELNLALPGLQ